MNHVIVRVGLLTAGDEILEDAIKIYHTMIKPTEELYKFGELKGHTVMSGIVSFLQGCRLLKTQRLAAYVVTCGSEFRHNGQFLMCWSHFSMIYLFVLYRQMG